MNNEKDSNKLVTIKEKIVTAVKENKKRTIAAALSLILGISVGTTKNISKEEHNNNIKTIAAISEHEPVSPALWYGLWHEAQC